MNDKYEIRPEQSVELLKALHILTRDGKMNQDSRRKLKQVQLERDILAKATAWFAGKSERTFTTSSNS